MSNKKNVLVFGFYQKKNFGDNLFEVAFKNLFPNFNFKFTDFINKESLQNIDAVFFGGGSFLFAAPDITSEALSNLKNKKIFYIGVGGETDIHPIHAQLMAQAKLIAIRSKKDLFKIKEINKNTIFIPDIVYCLLSKSYKNNKIKKSVLIFPNIEVVSKQSDPAWKHQAWEYFKSELSQFLDVLVENQYTIHFLPFCQSEKMNDNWAAIEIINKMNNRDINYLLNISFNEIDAAIKYFSQYDLIITQRFHGIVLAEMARTPYISIHHHDKLKYAYPSEGTKLDYYSINKNLLLENFFSTINMNFTDVLPIESNLFKELQERIEKEI